MHTRIVLILAALFCVTPAKAQNCSDLYSAIKRAAMYCDFFCDQQKLAPLQRAYEATCIVVAVPFSSLPFENLPDESESLMVSEFPIPQKTANPSSGNVFKLSTRELADEQSNRDQ
jgi:hypothetical protein